MNKEDAARATYARVEPLLREALGPSDIERVRLEILDGAAQAWPGERCIILTAKGEDGRIVTTHTLGDPEDAAKLQPAIDAFARSHGGGGMGFAPTINLLQAALVECRGTHTMQDLVDQICSGAAVLWAGARCAAVTEFQDLPQLRQLNVWLAAGDLKEMQAMRPGMEAFARAHGAASVHFGARLSRQSRRRCGGWARASGYEARWLHHYKELTP